jgi:trehalose/maltose hydrolase-like predicted phosphorylase
LRKEWNVLKETADFWVSRVKNKDGSYSILNVVGADEYAQHVEMTMHLRMLLLLSH